MKKHNHSKKTITSGSPHQSELLQRIQSFSFISWLTEHWQQLLVLFIFVIISYFNSIDNGFVSDDIPSIVQNPYIGNLTEHLKQASTFTQPFLYVITYSLFGLSSPAFRIINILFHIGTVLLVYLVISLLSKKNVAFFSALLFAIHPILVESITWISGGNYVRSAFFFFWSFLLYLLAIKKPKLLFFSVILYALSLFSELKAVVFPAFYVLFELSFGDIRKRWKYVLPFFIISFGLILVYIPLISGRVGDVSSNTLSIGSPGITWFDIPYAITYYLQLILWPHNLSLYHAESAIPLVEIIIRIVCFGIFLAAAIYSYKKDRYMFFWLMFFFISFFPTLTPIKISWLVAERYAYVGSLGIIAVVAYLLSRCIENKKFEVIGYLLFSLLICSLTVRTIMRNEDWQNEDTLWISTVKTAPLYPQSYNNLGDVYARQGNHPLAVESFKQAIRLNPYYVEAYHNAGNSYIAMNKLDEALASYAKAVQYNPLFWQSHKNMASIYFAQQKYDLSLAHMQKAISIYPQSSDFYVDLGMIYVKLNQKDKATEAFNTALQLNPQNHQAIIALSELK